MISILQNQSCPVRSAAGYLHWDIPSLDTAAVTSICPRKGDGELLFISSGAWRLLGKGLRAPRINGAVYDGDLPTKGESENAGNHWEWGERNA
ncbi:MAG: hypothetical protein LBQ14_08215 [Treponema sp.]|nr:hypothetical protein [Treponema sp.]